MSAQALIRDNYRCVLTGKLDDASLLAGLAMDDGSLVTTTRAARVFDQPTNESLGVGNKACYPPVDVSHLDTSVI